MTTIVKKNINGNQKLKNIILSLFVTVCVQTVSAGDAQSSLFQDFGGKAGLVRVVDDFMIELLAEPKTKASFINADQKHIKAMLVDQFCELLAGPCQYKGKSMEKSHAGLDIKKAEFNSLVESLRTAMSKNKIPMRAQNKLLAKLAPMHRDIIGK